MKIIDEKLLDEFRTPGSCEWCRIPCHEGRDPHHIFTRGMGGGSRLDIRINLVSLCRWCHTRHHYAGEPSRKSLLELVAAREDVLAADIIHLIHTLRRIKGNASSTASGEVQAYTGDQRNAVPSSQPPAGSPGSKPSMAPDEDDGWHEL